jgi:hypothetical protein
MAISADHHAGLLLNGLVAGDAARLTALTSLLSR